jgi:excinuclease UvrABC nuclease subunit
MSVLDYDGRINEAIPSIAGIYAVYDAAMRIQYVGTSQSVVSSVQSHVRDFPEDVTTFVKVRICQENEVFLEYESFSYFEKVFPSKAVLSFDCRSV